MLSGETILAISAAYAGLLFAIAYWGDRRAGRRAPGRAQPWIYSLALAVYCTSWTFYGAVGRAAERGWDYLPIYLGPMLIFVFGMPLIERLLSVCKQHNLTSIADFIGARYGRRQALAAGVSLIAVVGVLPYLALQLKAVAVTVEVLATPDAAPGGWLSDAALVTAGLLAVFAILFGTREVTSNENHHGMVLAVAFESVIKLAAFVVIGLLASYVAFDGLGEAMASALSLPAVQEAVAEPAWMTGFLAQTVLAMAAILCLPRQFQILVVENSRMEDLRTARWVFPLYLAVISLFVLPIAAAGAKLLPAAVNPDTYVLSVPLALDRPDLALFAYLGGFSAATSMVIVSTIALSTMLSNEVITPLFLRWRPPGLAQGGADLARLIKRVRRVSIVLLLLLAYFYTRFFTAEGSLASMGLLSFAAVIQFAPALVGGLYWKRATHMGVVMGLLAGFSVWAYTLLLPTLSGSQALWVLEGPAGIGWLRPQALFGFGGLDPVTHGTVFSLLVNVMGFLLGSWMSTPGLRDHLHALRFLGESPSPATLSPPPAVGGSATLGDLQTLLERFFAPERTRELLDTYGRERGQQPSPRDRAPADWVRYCERLLAGVLGASSARVVMASMLQGRNMQVEEVISLLDETSHALQFSRELTHAALEHLSQGVSVVDRDLRLVVWNRRYVELFGYPDSLMIPGQPIENLLRYNARHGLLAGEGGIEEQIQRRLDHMRSGRAYEHEREMPDGHVIEIRGNPMPGGGFVTSYADVTAYQRASLRLRELADTLEHRVRSRTEELSAVNVELAQAKAAADRANAAKTRFLAAATHDLIQPISAARMFLGAFDPEDASAPRLQTLHRQLDDSLAAAEQLLAGLLDISRLEAGAQPMQVEVLHLSEVLNPLAAEFAALARQQGITWRAISTRAIVRTDPALLRRVLQNFLSNALRYTDSGRVLLGCRRQRRGVRIEVWDTGPGIPEARRGEIFEEFRRLRKNDRQGRAGLGLGLAIAERVARLLGHPIGVRSIEGRGSVFWIEVPWGEPATLRSARPATADLAPSALQGLTVLVIDNEPAVLEGMTTLLERWGCTVVADRGQPNLAARAVHWPEIDLALIDYHLDDGLSGIALLEDCQRSRVRRIPGIVITADHTDAAREAAASAGYEVLPKPASPARLRALIQRVIEAVDLA